MKYFLLFLFLGYYGSITLFTHTHHIENGVIIVHSHPFKASTGNIPVNHNHTKNGYVLIQLLSNFLTTVSFLALSIEALKVFFRKINFQKNKQNFSNLAFLFSNGLRAPPFKYTS
ncbi:MAG: hypothetical protein HY951_03430 [Bacteroidia bacterium]|nr:hypothetical protein [Bacteroidia bacterium]